MRKPIEVTVVERRGESVVVQWRRPGRGGADGAVARALLPAEAVVDGSAEAADLRAGVLMSVDWAAEFRTRLSGEWFAAEMERLGVWTLDDLRAKALPAQRAVTRVAVEDMYDMLRRLSQGG